MPLISKSTYPGPRWFLFNGHLETVYPYFRKFPEVHYERERFTLPDGDFVDLDWLDNNSDKLLVLSHGLEGDSRRMYMKAMAKLFFDHGFDVLAWHCRSCSGEINRAFRLYHHGETTDFEAVLHHALQRKPYQKAVLIGFSMGGNITLKYLGTHDVPEPVRAAVAISSPLDLASSAETLNRWDNYFFKRRFTDSLVEKIKRKAGQFPEKIDLSKLELVKKWQDFDDLFSAPINGFKSAADLYRSGSARFYLDGIPVPSLIINAKNDPILTRLSFPEERCERHDKVYLESPRRGGHVGFSLPGKLHTWSEYRALEFVSEAGSG